MASRSKVKSDLDTRLAEKAAAKQDPAGRVVGADGAGQHTPDTEQQSVASEQTVSASSEDSVVVGSQIIVDSLAKVTPDFKNSTDVYNPAFGNALAAHYETAIGRLVDNKDAYAGFDDLDVRRLMAAGDIAKVIVGDRGGENTNSLINTYSDMILKVGPAVGTLNKGFAAPAAEQTVVADAVAPTNSSAPSPVVPEAKIVMEPDRVVSNDTIALSKDLQELVKGAVSNYNSIVMGGVSLEKSLLEINGLTKPLPEMPVTGDWDDKTLPVIGKLLGMLDGDDKTDYLAYTPKVGDGISTRISGLDGPEKMIMDKIISGNDLSNVVASLNKLSLANELRPVVMVEREVGATLQETLVAENSPSGALPPVSSEPVNKAASSPGGGNPKVPTPDSKVPPPVGKEKPEEPEQSKEEKYAGEIRIVEDVLVAMSNKSVDMPGFEGILGKLDGLRDSVLTRIGEDEAGGEFGASSQDAASKLIMGLKMAVADPKDKTPVNGEFNDRVKADLRVGILTNANPMLGLVRDEVSELSNISFDYISDTEYAKALLNFDNKDAVPPPIDENKASDAEKAAYNEKYGETIAAREAFSKAHGDDLANLRRVDLILNSMDTLQSEGIYSNSEARKITPNNLMLDAGFAVLSDYAPGLLDMIKGFLSGPIGDLISMVTGVNIGRLWGDKDDSAAEKRALGASGKWFDKEFKAAEKDLDGKPVSEVIGAACDSMESKATKGISGLAIGKAMGFLFDGADDKLVQKAVSDALEAARGKGSHEDAKAAFVDSLEASSIEIKGKLNPSAPTVKQGLEVEKVFNDKVDAGKNKQGADRDPDQDKAEAAQKLALEAKNNQADPDPTKVVIPQADPAPTKVVIPQDDLAPTEVVIKDDLAPTEVNIEQARKDNLNENGDLVYAPANPNPFEVGSDTPEIKADQQKIKHETQEDSCCPSGSPYPHGIREDYGSRAADIAWQIKSLKALFVDSSCECPDAEEEINVTAKDSTGQVSESSDSPAANIWTSPDSGKPWESNSETQPGFPDK